MERHIQAPDKEWLDEEEAAQWLTIKGSHFLDLVKKGVIPQGTPFGARLRRWHWTKVLAVGYLMEHLIDRIKEEDG